MAAKKTLVRPTAKTKPTATKAPKKATGSAAKAPKGKPVAKAGPASTKAAPRRASAPMFERVAFTMFPVQDAVRARAFYEDVLGLTRGLASPDGVWTEYDLPGGGCLALFRHPGGSTVTSGGAGIAFEVRDLDALNERLMAAGVDYQGGLIHGPHCRMSNIKDTEGNAIILHELS